MANKKSIQDVDRDLDRWHKKLTMAVSKIDQLRTLRKKLIQGKIKHPPPKGIKVKIKKTEFLRNASAPDWDDVIPSLHNEGEQ